MIGLSDKIAKEETLKHKDFMGQYGIVKKIIVNKDKPFNKGSYEPSYSAYVTFSSNIEAATAIVAMDGKEYDNRTLKASFGLSKYCMSYIKNSQCGAKGCPYLHKTAREEDTFTKEEANSSKVLQKIHNHGALDLLACSSRQFVQTYRNSKDGGKFSGIREVEKLLRDHCAKNSLEYGSNNISNTPHMSAKQNSKFESEQIKNVKLIKLSWAKDVDTSFSSAKSTNPETKNPKILEDDKNNVEGERQSLNLVQPRPDIGKSNSTNTSPRKQESQLVKFGRNIKQIILDFESSLEEESVKKQSMDTTFSDKVAPPSPSSNNQCLKDTKSTTSTLNTTHTSEISRIHSLENQIETSISQKPEEYGDLDKLILNQLNKSYLEKSANCQKQKKEKCMAILNEDNQDEYQSVKQVKRLIDIFLQPNDFILGKLNLWDDNQGIGNVYGTISKMLAKKTFEGDGR